MHHRRLLPLALACALGLGAAPASADGQPAAPSPAPAGLTIAHKKLTLDNGLVVLLSEDRSLPTVTVSVMVGTGSRFEAQGRSGFAHLFEHLMFMGTERVPTGQFDELMEAQGAYNNAWTSEDRTYYYSVGPSHALPLLLWLEADRLGSLSAAMTQEKLDAQRAVVKNERRQRVENKPYGKASLRLPELLYPKGHPYHHPVIGSHADLEAASVEDVRAFFAEHYGPDNLILTVVGDFDARSTEERIRRLFGGLERRAKAAPPEAPPVTLGSVVTETLEDDVELSRITSAWHSAPLLSQEDAALDVLASVLTKGKSSRLQKALVYDRQLAQSVSAGQDSQEKGSVFRVDVLLRREATQAEVKALMDDQIALVADKGITDEELRRAKNAVETAFVRGLEATDNRAEQLATYQSYLGDAGAIDRDLARYRAVTKEAVQEVAKRYLDPGRRVVLIVVPSAAAQAKAKAGPKEPK